MDVLVIYQKVGDKRRTTNDHLYSFRRYARGHRFFYLNAKSEESITQAIIDYPFDVVIIHYTLLNFRFRGKLCEKIHKKLTQLKGTKVMIPHDEYYYPAALWEIAIDCNVEKIFTSCSQHDFEIIFPSAKLGRSIASTTVFTGYVEESLIPKCRRLASKIEQRPIDIGYRARTSMFRFGRHGMIKESVAHAFLDELKSNPKIQQDIALNQTTNDALFGDSWLKFLASCKTVLGCLGGSSVIDEDGKTSEQIYSYIKTHEDATFEEIEKNFYSGRDGEISAFLLGPRHFESALTRTCQLLVEGDYHGVFEPGVDYIEIKKDFSNIPEILQTISDAEYCKKIAEQCYSHVIESGKYTYRSFVNTVLSETAALCAPQTQPQRFIFLCFAHWFERILRKILSIPKRVLFFFTNQFSERMPRLYFAMKYFLLPNRKDSDDPETMRDKERGK